MPTMTKTDNITFRKPAAEDGRKVYELIKACPPLEVNTCYSYVLLCSDFADTCVVAELEGEVVGFVAAYKPPRRANAVFVWQIAVGEKARGKGLGKRMLQELVSREACKGLSYLESTVAPTNVASAKLFQGFGKSLETGCEVKPWFDETLFGEPGEHEEELLFRIGPLPGAGVWA